MKQDSPVAMEEVICHMRGPVTGHVAKHCMWPLGVESGPDDSHQETSVLYLKEWNSANNHMNVERDPELQKGSSLADNLTAASRDPKNAPQSYAQTPNLWKLK